MKGDCTEMKKLLVVIDKQNDFVDGSLGTEEAMKIVPEVQERIEHHKSEGQEVVFTIDTHYDNYLETLEGKNLPVEHCKKETEG
ncbi:isochorismatase family protein, partial [[Clostridium] symbiosum]